MYVVIIDIRIKAYRAMYMCVYISRHMYYMSVCMYSVKQQAILGAAMVGVAGKSLDLAGPSIAFVFPKGPSTKCDQDSGFL